MKIFYVQHLIFVTMSAINVAKVIIPNEAYPVFVSQIISNKNKSYTMATA